MYAYRLPVIVQTCIAQLCIAHSTIIWYTQACHIQCMYVCRQPPKLEGEGKQGGGGGGGSRSSSTSSDDSVEAAPKTQR